MQTAIRDQERDAVLLVSIDSGTVSFAGVSLTGKKLEEIKNYNIDYWQDTKSSDQKFNFRLLPYLTKKVLIHYYFWIGFVSSLLMLLIVRFLYVKWKKRR